MGGKVVFSDRIKSGFDAVKEIVGKVWLYVLLGIVVGAGAHGYVPQEFMASLMGKDAWYSVPLFRADRHPFVFECGRYCPHRFRC